MLTSNEYTKSKFYEQNWIDNHSIRIPWLNFLTSQSIPEETDDFDCSTHKYIDSECSSISEDDLYVVLGIKRTQSIITEPTLNFEEIHEIQYNQYTQPLIIQTPVKVNTITVEPQFIHKKYAKVTQLLIQNNEQCQNSIISLDSIENHSIFSPQSKFIKETSPTFRRSFVFDHACMIKYPEKSTTPSFDSTNRSSSILRLIKKCNRTVKSEYHLSINEPSLIQIKPLDGRPTLIDLNALESFKKSSQSNLMNISSTQDLSFRKRLLNRVRNFLKPSSIDLSKIRQQKTIFQLINQKKSKQIYYS